MSCDRQKGEAREEVSKKDVGERERDLQIIGNTGASGKFQQPTEYVWKMTNEMTKYSVLINIRQRDIF